MQPRVTVKKRLIIFHDAADWSAIYRRILEDYGMAMSISFRMRRELGFSHRRHSQWISDSQGQGFNYLEDQVHLDFYSDSAQSWFTLKYLNREDRFDQ